VKGIPFSSSFTDKGKLNSEIAITRVLQDNQLKILYSRRKKEKKFKHYRAFTPRNCYNVNTGIYKTILLFLYNYYHEIPINTSEIYLNSAEPLHSASD